MFHDIKQNDDEWYQIRLGKATASKFGIVMANEGKDFGEPAKRYALELALERINGAPSQNQYSNEHMERGVMQEPIARSLYEDTYFCEVKNGGFFDLGRVGCSPDGLVDNDGAIEIKSVIASTHYATLTRKSFDPTYKWQLIGHLLCTDREWIDFVSYCADFPEEKQIIVHRLYRRDYSDEIINLSARLNKFLNLVGEIQTQITEK